MKSITEFAFLLTMPQKITFTAYDFEIQNAYSGFDYFESNDASMISSAGVQSDGATFYGDEALFDDEMFNGTEKEISIDFFDYKSFWFEEEGIEVQFILELTSVSESYYTYIRSLRAHYDNQDQFIFAGEPVQVFTNIENGLGVLGSMSVDNVLRHNIEECRSTYKAFVSLF